MTQFRNFHPADDNRKNMNLPKYQPCTVSSIENILTDPFKISHHETNCSVHQSLRISRAISTSVTEVRKWMSRRIVSSGSPWNRKYCEGVREGCPSQPWNSAVETPANRSLGSKRTNGHDLCLQQVERWHELEDKLDGGTSNGGWRREGEGDRKTEVGKHAVFRKYASCGLCC